MPHGGEPDISWHALTAEEALARLESGGAGLGAGEAAERLKTAGPNTLPVEKGMTPWRILLHQFADPLIYFLLAAAVVTVLLREYIDAAVIVAVVLVNAAIGYTQELSAERAMESLAKLASPRARVLRGGRQVAVETAQLVPGDLVLLEAGDRVPADLRLTEVHRLRAEEAALTGESVPVDKTAEALPGRDLSVADRVNLAFMGTVITAGRGRGVVVATGARTEIGRIATAVQTAEQVRTPLQERMARFSHQIGVAILVIAVLSFGIGVLAGRPLVEMFLVAVALAVSAIPEGLPVVLTLTLAAGVRRMAQRGAIIRKLPAVETLGSCTVIGSDKTGTLTQNQMTVQRLYAGGRRYQVTGTGLAGGGVVQEGGPHPGSAVTLQGSELTRGGSVGAALRIGLLTNDARFEGEGLAEELVGDPTEGALLVSARKAGLSVEDLRRAYPRRDEIPFESQRQYMATLHEHGGRRLLLVKGAPDAVVPRCGAALAAEAETQAGTEAGTDAGTHGGAGPGGLFEVGVLEVPPEAVPRATGPAGPVPLDQRAVLDEMDRMAADGLRVLAMAFRELAPGEDFTEATVRDLTFAGLQGMIDPPRPEVPAAIRGARRAGVRVVMITGDHATTALAIARRLGIAEAGGSDRLITGRDMLQMADEALRERLKTVNVFARVAPEQKLRIVQQLLRLGHVVAITGDGVNDAPALRAAHLGVAMGRSGTDVAREASDMVLTDDNFASIYSAVGEGRVVFENVRKVTFFLISSSAGEVFAVLVALVLGLPLPFLPAQILWINLVTNGLQDVALAFEPGEPGVTRRPPRPRGEGVFNRLMLWRSAIVGLLLAFGTLGVFLFELRQGASIEAARTAAVTTIVIFQLYHAFNSRSFERSLFQMNPLGNRFLLFGVLASLAAQLAFVHLPFFQGVFRTASLDFVTWVLICLVAASVVVAVEVDKWIRRSGQRQELYSEGSGV